MSLQEFSDNWTAGWNYLWQQTQALYADKVRSNPQAYEGQVATFMRDLAGARADLDAIKASLGPRGNKPDEVARFNRLARQHYELANRFYTDTRPAQQTQMGFVPVLIVLGLAVGVSATAWAAGAWQYATNLREQTALASRELDARIAASKEGRTLQTSTLPAPPPPEPSTTGMLASAGKLLIGGLVLAAGVMFVPQLLGRK